MFHQVVAIAVVLVVFVDDKEVATLTPDHWLALLMLGLFSTAIAHTLLTYSLKQLAAKSVALIGCLQPPVAALLAWLVMNEVPQVWVVAGGAMILSVAVYESLQKR